MISIICLSTLLLTALFCFSGIEKEWTVHLHDSSGRLIRELNQNEASHAIQPLPDGVYFFKISSKETTLVVVNPIIKH